MSKREYKLYITSTYPGGLSPRFDDLFKNYFACQPVFNSNKRKKNLTVMLLATTDEIATAKAARESFMIR